MNLVPNQQILAFNDAEQSENRIHSDEIAAKHGFSGALVSGANVFGYLTQPLVKAFGPQFLEQGLLDVVFLKPAYQDDLLTIKTEELEHKSSHRHHITRIFNETNQLLATLESSLPLTLPPVNDLSNRISTKEPLPPALRPEINWQVIKLMEPAPAFLWQPGTEENQQHVQVQRDTAACYQGTGAMIHPYFLLDACNQALMRLFVLPAWLHIGSKICLRQPLHLGETIEIRTVPIHKWEHKGHQFIKLYIAMWKNGQVATEIEHTAIFSIAD